MTQTVERISDEALVIIDPIERERTVERYSGVTQFLTWPIIFIIFYPLFQIKIIGRQNLKKISSPFIIISNHISFYDSFLFRIALGFFTPHLPLRFMAVKKFNWRYLNILAKLKIIDVLYALFGVFTIVPGKGISQNLKEAKLILEAGGNIVIYPEGRIMTNGELGEFKIGAAVLAQQLMVPVIPLSFKLTKKIIRKEILINIGEPRYLSTNKQPQVLTEELRREITSLLNES